jgi:hypothetical protein
MIVVKKLSGRGLGNLKNPASIMGAVFPPVLGGILAAAGAYGMQMLGEPKKDSAGVPVEPQTDTQKFLQSWAPLLGIGIGAAGSLAVFATVGAPQGVSALAGAVVSGGSLAVKKMIDTSRLEELKKTSPDAATLVAEVLDLHLAEPVTMEGYRGYRGYGAVVPQASNMRTGAIVMAPVRGVRGTRGLRGQYQAVGPTSGEVVTLGSVNQAAFGTPGFLQGRR